MKRTYVSKARARRITSAARIQRAAPAMYEALKAIKEYWDVAGYALNPAAMITDSDLGIHEVVTLRSALGLDREHKSGSTPLFEQEQKSLF